MRASRRTRFLTSDDDIEGLLRDYGLLPVRVEGPKNVYVFPRVKRGSTVIHVVNWNITRAGRTDAFANVTLTLDRTWNWGNTATVKYYRPGQRAGLPLQPEFHHDLIRLTLPRLETWGVVEITP